MTWTFSAEEWLVDFTSAPRGAPRETKLDPLDEQTRGLLSWIDTGPQLVMPSMVPRREPPPKAAPIAAPSPLSVASGEIIDDDDDYTDGLEIELQEPSQAKPDTGLGVFIPTLTRGAGAPLRPSASDPESAIPEEVLEPDEVEQRPIADDLFDEDDEDSPALEAPPLAAVSGMIGDDDEDADVDDDVVEDVEDVEEEDVDDDVVEVSGIIVLEDLVDEAEAAQVGAAEAHKPPAPPIPPPSPRTPPPVTKPPPRPAADAPAPAKARSKRRKKWYDEVFADQYASILPRDSDASAELDVEFMIESAKLTPESSILDVGCGDGRHLFGFAKVGYAELTGLDMSISQLVAGSRRNLSESAGLTFLYGDMRDLPDGGSYDVITCLGGTLGYFEDEQNRACLQQMVERLAPGGKLIIQVMNRDYMMSIAPCRSWWQGRSCLVLDVAEMNFFANRLKVHRTIVFEDGRQFEHHIQVRAYTINELGKMISGLGLRVLEVSGSRDTRGRFFGSASPDIWICAQRKD